MLRLPMFHSTDHRRYAICPRDSRNRPASCHLRSVEIPTSAYPFVVPVPVYRRPAPTTDSDETTGQTCSPVAVFFRVEAVSLVLSGWLTVHQSVVVGALRLAPAHAAARRLATKRISGFEIMKQGIHSLSGIRADARNARLTSWPAVWLPALAWAVFLGGSASLSAALSSSP